MTLGFGIKVILEVAVILLITYGIFNEDKLIAFEDELAPVLRFCFHKYILKDVKKTNKTPVSHQQKSVRQKATFKVISGKQPTHNVNREVA
ncbi:MAG: hypothetical protein Q4F70_03785 [Clostridia bacterium]|nr:hypothetical protein [Clostridia bacterium]